MISPDKVNDDADMRVILGCLVLVMLGWVLTPLGASVNLGFGLLGASMAVYGSFKFGQEATV